MVEKRTPSDHPASGGDGQQCQVDHVIIKKKLAKTFICVVMFLFSISFSFIGSRASADMTDAEYGALIEKFHFSIASCVSKSGGLGGLWHGAVDGDCGDAAYALCESLQLAPFECYDVLGAAWQRYKGDKLQDLVKGIDKQGNDPESGISKDKARLAKIQLLMADRLSAEMAKQQCGFLTNMAPEDYGAAVNTSGEVYGACLVNSLAARAIEYYVWLNSIK